MTTINALLDYALRLQQLAARCSLGNAQERAFAITTIQDVNCILAAANSDDPQSYLEAHADQISEDAMKAAWGLLSR